jgi:hypothetical protein
MNCSESGEGVVESKSDEEDREGAGGLGGEMRLLRASEVKGGGGMVVGVVVVVEVQSAAAGVGNSCAFRAPQSSGEENH